jgi:hypothetical protein
MPVSVFQPLVTACAGGWRGLGCRWWLLAGVGLLLWLGVVAPPRVAAQPALDRSAFNLFPDSFPDALRKRLNYYKADEAQQFGRKLEAYWNQGYLRNSEQRDCIQQVNTLLAKGWSLYPEISSYLSTFMTIRHPLAKVSIDVNDFISVTDSVVKYAGRSTALNYFKFLQAFVPQAVVSDNSSYTWRISQREPRLVFKQPDPDDEDDTKESFPALQFSNTNLIFKAKTKDSTQTAFKEIKGYYNLFNRNFIGEGGTYDWSRMGLNPAEVYCQLPDRYKINLNFKGFIIKDAVLHYNGLLDKPLKGILTEEIAYVRDTNNAVYPQFRSTEGGLEIRNFIPHVTYRGGFSLLGITKYGSAVDTVRIVTNAQGESSKVIDRIPAVLEISNAKGQGIMRLQSDLVKLNPQKLDAGKSRVSIYLPGFDSLYHQGMEMTYDVKTQDMLLLLDRDDQLSWQPIMNSYNKVGMYFDAIRWNPNNDSIFFTALVDQRHKVFAVESYDFFRLQRFAQLRGTMSYHPIGMLYTFYKEYNQSKEEQKIRSQIARLKKAERERQRKAELDEWSFDEKDPADEEGFEEETTEDEDDFYSDEDEDDPFADRPARKPNTPATTPTPKPATSRPAGKPSAEYANEFRKLQEELAKRARQSSKIRTFTLTKVLKKYNLLDKKQIYHQSMGQLKSLGLIEYDSKTEQITLLAPFFHWARSAAQVKDYDQISMISMLPGGNNAILSYSKKRLELLGVREFTLSDSQLVSVVPLRSKVFVDANRDMQFSGQLNAGKVSFVSEVRTCDRFKFDYKEFKIRSDSVDYMRFFPRKGTIARGTPTKLVNALEKLKIENISGVLYIDEPRNKSGIKSASRYPAFDCYTQSYVYWLDSLRENRLRRLTQNDPVRQSRWLKSYRSKKSYDREYVRFKIDPFLIDSLESFDIRRLQFRGSFVAEDIFPEFAALLRPTQDDTYGVEDTFSVAAGGVPVYKGKGRFYGSRTMDDYALHCKGRIDYLGSRAVADTFVFAVDSVMGLTTSFYQPDTTINGIKFPRIEAGRLEYTWYPNENRLVLNSFREPIKLYKGGAEFLGSIVITPQGMRADGEFIVQEVSLASKSFKLTENGVEADAGQLKVADPTLPTKLYFSAQNAQVRYDMNTNRATFESNEGSKANYAFPQQRFKTSLGKGTFNKETGEIRLGSQSAVGENNYFESTDPNKRGLRFIADSAYFNSKTAELTVKGIDSIRVADAVIYPDSQVARIQEGGNIAQLKNARIVANTRLRAHTFEHAIVDVISATNYTANGERSYVPIEGKPQTIFFTNIRVASDSQTVARAIVRQDDGFFISKRIMFRDTIIAYGNEKYMSFRGKVKIQSENPAFRDSWFDFQEDRVNPDTVVVTIGEKTLGSNTVGIHFWDDRALYYSTFIEQKKNKGKDADLLLASGVLTVDPKTNEFRIGDRDKIEAKNYSGNVVSYDDEKRIVTARGLFTPNYHELGDPALKSPFQYGMAGLWRNNQESKTVRTNLLYNINLPPELKSIIQATAKKVQFITSSETPLPVSQTRDLLEAASEFMGPAQDPARKEANLQKLVDEFKDADEIRASQLNLAKEMGAPTLSLWGIKFAFCDTAKAFYTTSPKFGLVSYAGIPINRYLNNCKMEFKLGKRLPNNTFRSDTMRIFISFNEFDYLYIELAGSEYKTLSSMPDYNKAIMELAAKTAKKAEKAGPGTLKVSLATERDKEVFVERTFPVYTFTNCGID